MNNFEKGFPESGDLVICTVEEVMDFGAFVSLDEYEDKRGLIHISEVAPGWVKYIRDHIREGQKMIVCKVLNVDKRKGHIDLSLKDVNDHQRRNKLKLWKNEKKAQKWMQIIATDLELSEAETMDMAKTIYDDYGGHYGAFEEAVNKEESLKDLDLRSDIIEKIAEIANENIIVSSVSINGYMDLTCLDPRGIEIIKTALNKGYNVQKDNSEVQLEITYFGAPRYRIKVTSLDYKMAENVLKSCADATIDYIKKHDGSGKFYRKLGN